MDISSEEFNKSGSIASSNKEDVKADQNTVKQDNVDTQQADLLQQQAQAELLLQQQAALLAQQQAAEALALQQAASQTTSSGDSEGFVNAQLNANMIVYVTPSGKKYHYDRDCAGPNAIEIDYN